MLLHIGVSFLERLLRLPDLRFILAERSFQIARIHARHPLAGLDERAFVDKEGRDRARELGVDVDLVGLDPPVAPGDAGRQPRLMLLPPKPADPRAAADHQEKGRNRETRPPSPLGARGRSLDDGREAAALLFRLGG